MKEVSRDENESIMRKWKIYCVTEEEERIHEQERALAARKRTEEDSEKDRQEARKVQEAERLAKKEVQAKRLKRLQDEAKNMKKQKRKMKQGEPEVVDLTDSEKNSKKNKYKEKIAELEFELAKERREKVEVEVR